MGFGMLEWGRKGHMEREMGCMSGGEGWCRCWARHMDEMDVLLGFDPSLMQWIEAEPLVFPSLLIICYAPLVPILFFTYGLTLSDEMTCVSLGELSWTMTNGHQGIGDTLPLILLASLKRVWMDIWRVDVSPIIINIAGRREG